MKQYNCPDCQMTNGSCEGCSRTFSTTNTTNISITTPINLLDTLNNNYFIPIQCRGCSNHPSNGGSGICNCIIGSMDIRY